MLFPFQLGKQVVINLPFYAPPFYEQMGMQIPIKSSLTPVQIDNFWMQQYKVWWVLGIPPTDRW